MNARTHTPDRITTDDHGLTTTTFKLKRACNGCGTFLGDVTDAEMDHAVRGLPADDVRGECEHCRPLVALEAAGCKTWRITERTISRVDDEVDRLGVFAKGYWQEVDGKLQVVGLRVGQYPDHVVAYFGDWLVMDLEGQFTVRSAPVAEEQPAAPRANCPACAASIEHDVHCPSPESHNWGCGCPSDVAAAIASCPGRELAPSPCRCPCKGCAHHCAAHDPSTVIAAPPAGRSDRPVAREVEDVPESEYL